MTDISSKGLLPQLTDVLHVFTDSHQLLLCKVRSVRLEHMSSWPLAVEKSLHTQFADFVDSCPLALVATKTGTRNDTYRAFGVDRTETGKGPSSPASSDSDLSADLAPASAEVTHPKAPVHWCTSTGTSTEIVTPRHDTDAAIPTQAPTPPEGPTSALADTNSAESANRNYNFFDDLDMRLAALNNPESGSEEH